MTRIHLKHSIVINVPIKSIFAYMSKLENLSDWSSIVISIHATSSVEGLGASASSTIRFLGQRTAMTFMLVECQPYRLLTIKSTSGVTPCLFHYQFERLEDGGTSIAQDAIISLIGGLGNVPEQKIINALQRDAEYALLTLKDTLETRHETYQHVARV